MSLVLEAFYITGTPVVFALSLWVLLDLSGLINLAKWDGKRNGSREITE